MLDALGERMAASVITASIGVSAVMDCTAASAITVHMGGSATTITHTSPIHCIATRIIALATPMTPTAGACRMHPLAMTPPTDAGSPLRSYVRHVHLSLLALGLLLTACAADQIRGHTYINEAKGYLALLPSDAWNVEMDNEADLVLRHRSSQAGIMVNATCDDALLDRSVEVVMRHLFFGIREKEILSQDRRTTSQGEAVEVVLRGELGGQRLLLHGYTLKGSDCVYDLVLFASPETYSRVNEEFEALIHRFQLSRGQRR